MRHLVTAVGADALATRAGGFGSTHTARALSLTTPTALSSSTSHDFLLAHAVQLAFHFVQLLAQHVCFFLEPA
jgi:hypothetical protein